MHDPYCLWRWSTPSGSASDLQHDLVQASAPSTTSIRRCRRRWPIRRGRSTGDARRTADEVGTAVDADPARAGVGTPYVWVHDQIIVPELPIELAECVSIQGCNNFGLRFGLSLGAPPATRVCAESASIETGICQL